MSLINDALRKARKEASAQESPLQRRHLNQRRKLRSGLWLALIGTAVFAALLGAGSIWWLLRPVSSRDIPTQGSPGELPGNYTSPVSPTPHNPTTKEAAESLADKDIPKDPLNTPPHQLAPPSTKAKAPKTPLPAIPLAQVMPAPSRPETERPTPQPISRVFVAEATINGHHLTLDYLVYKETRPFAQINGTIVGEGAMIEGLVLEKVTESSIILSSGDDRFTIKISR